MHPDIVKNLRIILNFLIASDPIESISACDAVFLFGSRRTDQIPKSGSRLFKKGLAQKIVCTGKYTLRQTSGPFGFATEAEWYEDILIREGVPKEVIILETKSTNTLENVLFGISTCHRQEFYPKSLILCPIPPLCRRSLATFKKQFPKVKIIGYAPELPIEYYFTPGRIERALGEFERFREYATKGDMVSVEVPESIQAAVNFLKNIIAKT